MVLRFKTLNFHIFEKMKIEKNLKIKLKKFENTSLTINNQKIYISIFNI